MKPKLHEAALTGSVDLLHSLFRQDPTLLDQPPPSAPHATTPLHVATLYGYPDFVRAALDLKPDLSRRRDPTGSLPLHLAASRADVEIVQVLARADPGACLERDEEGLTPIHVAALKGRAGGLAEMVRANPDAVRALTEGGETAVHLCCKNNRLDALKLLVDGLDGSDGDVEFLNKRDRDGNTALHLSVKGRHVEIVKYLVGKKIIEVNTLNSKGLTALDMVESGWTEFADANIETTLIGAGAERRGTLFSNQTESSVDLRRDVSAINSIALIEGTSSRNALASSSTPVEWKQGEQAAATTFVDAAHTTDRLSTKRFINTDDRTRSALSKKKVVLKVDVLDDICKKRLMKAIAGIDGVDTISANMQDKQFTIIGSVDVVQVIKKIPKKMHVEIIYAGPAEEVKKKDRKKDEEKKESSYATSSRVYYPYMNNCYRYELAEEDPNACVVC